LSSSFYIDERKSTQASIATDSTTQDIVQSTLIEENTQNSTNDTLQNSSNSHREIVVALQNSSALKWWQEYNNADYDKDTMMFSQGLPGFISIL
jgi:hypothetical protein